MPSYRGQYPLALCNFMLLCLDLSVIYSCTARAAFASRLVGNTTAKLDAIGFGSASTNPRTQIFRRLEVYLVAMVIEAVYPPSRVDPYLLAAPRFCRFVVKVIEKTVFPRPSLACAEAAYERTRSSLNPSTRKIAESCRGANNILIHEHGRVCGYVSSGLRVPVKLSSLTPAGKTSQCAYKQRRCYTNLKLKFFSL